MLLNNSRDYPLRLIAGFRYLDLHDDLNIDETALVAPGWQVLRVSRLASATIFPATTISTAPTWASAAVTTCGVWSCRPLFNAASAFARNASTCRAGRALAAPMASRYARRTSGFGSNSGTRIRDVFAVVPEADLDARYEITRHRDRQCRLFVPVLERGRSGRPTGRYSMSTRIWSRPVTVTVNPRDAARPAIDDSRHRFLGRRACILASKGDRDRFAKHPSGRSGNGPVPFFWSQESAHGPVEEIARSASWPIRRKPRPIRCCWNDSKHARRQH